MAVCIPYPMFKGLQQLRLAYHELLDDKRGYYLKRAIYFLEQVSGAEHQLPRASYELGFISEVMANEEYVKYQNGENYSASRFASLTCKAVEDYQRAASMPDTMDDQSPAKALSALANLCEQGVVHHGKFVGLDDTLVPDFEEVFDLRLRAAKMGHPLSQYEVGMMYYFGRGVERSLGKALYWVGKSGSNSSKLDVAVQSELANNLRVMMMQMVYGTPSESYGAPRDVPKKRRHLELIKGHVPLRQSDRPSP